MKLFQINKNINVIFWRELRRQKYLKNILLIQILLSNLILFFMMNENNFIKIFLESNIIFVFVTQGDIFFYDLNNSIESMIVLPITIKDIIKNKSKFAIIKATLISIITVEIYDVKFMNVYKFINIYNIINVIFIIIFEYEFSLIIGKLAWIKGRKVRMVSLIFQTIVFLIIDKYYNSQYFSIILILFIISSIIISLILNKFIDHENIIERSFY